MTDLQKIEKIVLSAFFDEKGDHYQDVHCVSPSVLKAKNLLVKEFANSIHTPHIKSSTMRCFVYLMTQMGYKIKTAKRGCKASPQIRYIATKPVEERLENLVNEIVVKTKLKPKISSDIELKPTNPGLEFVQVVSHPDDFEKILEYAFALRVTRGLLTEEDKTRIINDFIENQKKIKL